MRLVLDNKLPFESVYADASRIGRLPDCDNDVGRVRGGLLVPGGGRGADDMVVAE